MTDKQPASPPPARDPNTSSGRMFEFNRPTVVVLFFLASYFTVFSGLIGVILAYVWKAEPLDEWEETHYTFLIRTFWIALMLVVLAAVLVVAAIFAAKAMNQGEGQMFVAFIIALSLIPIGAIWLLLRCVVSLVRAQKRQPMPHPRSWLV